MIYPSTRPVAVSEPSLEVSTWAKEHFRLGRLKDVRVNSTVVMEVLYLSMQLFLGNWDRSNNKAHTQRRLRREAPSP